jgi:hypothetical protein
MYHKGVTGPIMLDFNRWLNVLSVIQLSGGVMCNFKCKCMSHFFA